MLYGNTLPATGGVGALVVAHFLGLDDIITAAIIAVLFGIAAFRYSARIGRARKTILALVGAAALGVAFVANAGGLTWRVSTGIALAAAVAALYLSSRIVPQERRAVA